MTIGSQVAAWRQQAGLTQAQLAERLGVTQSAVGNYEAGRNDVSREMLARIAQALGVDQASVFAAAALPQHAPVETPTEAA